MLWLRKGFVNFLAVILLISLVGMALATSTNQTLGNPKKVETLLSQSKLYDHFVSYATSQAKQDAGGSEQSGTVSLNDSAVQSAARTAFSSQLIEQNVNTFLDSNYAWLEGKTATPDFKIDLSAAKESFAQQVGQYVKTFTAGLPVCTPAELAQRQQQAVDPLTATCRPSAISPEVAGAQVTEQLGSSGDFLSNPVITASTINPEKASQNKPYYQKYPHLPQLYRVAKKLPLIFAGLSVVTAAAVIMLATTRRKGIKRVGTALVLSGILLIVLKFVGDFGFGRVEHKVFNNANNGQLQQSLTDFAHRVQSAMGKTDLLFGIVFLVFGLIIFGSLRRTHKDNPKDAGQGSPKPDDHIVHAEDTPLVPATPESPTGVRLPAPKKRPKPRLIQ